MRTPHTVSEERKQEGFASAHQRMRENGETGAVESVDGDAGAVFLDGVVVYARHGNETGDDALGSLAVDDSAVRVEDCRPDDVRMFRTYVRYLGDDAVLGAEPLEAPRVEMQRVEGVLVDGVRNLAAASWRGESDTSDRTFFPKGDRVGLVADAVSLKRHVAAHNLTGYAAGDGKVVTFRDGEMVDGDSVDLHDPVRSEVGAGGGWVVVDSDIDDEDDPDEDDGGFLSRIF